jgi:ABC-2 type transport system ATP-binding protein
MIYADHLTKYFGHQPAIKNLSFHVNKGEILGFLGPTGAGKTTTMRILTAYMSPTEGTARVNGYDVFYDSLEVRKRVGYLPEAAALYGSMTVADYLDFVAALRKVNHRVRRVKETMDQVGLTCQANTVIGKLPKATRQRVGLAQAIIHNPAVLLLDEPTAGLDPQQFVEIRQLIRQLGSRHTIILSTNILSEVEQICDRVLVINKGQIIAEDTPTGLACRLEDDPFWQLIADQDVIQ